jgi:ABC-2 type transport system permease protein
MKNFRRYVKVWYIFAISSFQVQLMVRWGLVLFMSAKLLRYGIFIFFIWLLLSQTSSIAGYNLDQTIFFFLTFSLIDTLTQTLLREVYRFRPAIITGTFDFYLTKPYNPLFRALFSAPDIMDLVLLIPLFFVIIYFFQRLNITEPLSIMLYIFFIILGFLIALALHIFVLSLAVLTTEIDHAILVYRDITGMGRFPIDIYKEPIRGLLTFVLPVGIMMSFPVKALIGGLSIELISYALLFTALIFYLSLKAWGFAIKRYSSVGG